MKFGAILLIIVLAFDTLAFAEDPATQDPTSQAAPTLNRRKPANKTAADTHIASALAASGRANSEDVLSDEVPNLKADLAELRAMLNVLASQESGADVRTSAALQTNRKMWQIVIARLAELTQRLEAADHRSSELSPTPRK